MSDPKPPRGPTRKRWLALITGAISVLIGVLYLALITILDSRGPLRPPPPEALGLMAPVEVEAVGVSPAAAVPPPG